MPNWCANHLVVKHDDTAMVKKLVEGFNNDGLFSAFFAKPEDVTDWHTWNVGNWGTKWDVTYRDGSDVRILSPNYVIFNFATAWSPPIAFYEGLKGLGFEVDAMYFEPGMCFCGEWADGFETHIHIDEPTHSWVVANVPPLLDEVFDISGHYAEYEDEIEEQTYAHI
ncbi:hypothetical protein UFOVP235_65 [uncultured Caudovirales phage]|uniref:YubB ferredoxin-like domain-containing protein n=1 Tax=uncultured Caudovirales phage TaxID=2100421 RepID=A0A6J7WZJ6_9CAUD|nr:hypothetical protein UFOVP235_65 [uncultured Caudovirales phage]